MAKIRLAHKNEPDRILLGWMELHRLLPLGNSTCFPEVDQEGER